MKHVFGLISVGVIAYAVGKIRGCYEMGLAIAAAGQYPEVEEALTTVVKNSVDIHKKVEKLRS